MLQKDFKGEGRGQKEPGWRTGILDLMVEHDTLESSRKWFTRAEEDATFRQEGQLYATL